MLTGQGVSLVTPRSFSTNEERVLKAAEVPAVTDFESSVGGRDDMSEM